MSLLNGSFEDGWSTDPLTGRQIPHHWSVICRQPGVAMMSAGVFPSEDPPVIDTVTAIPECVHKLAWQLPPDEQLGGTHALILDGQTTYKVFGHAFSATLSQVVSVPFGSTIFFNVPIQVHHHGDGSWGACAARVCIDVLCTSWYTFHSGFPDPENPGWAMLRIGTTVIDAETLLSIDFEGRAQADVSFFTDAITLEIEEPEPQCRGLPREDFKRVCNVLPQNATLARFLEVAALAYPQRQEVGFSHDGAGIGDLADKTVKAWDIAPVEQAVFVDWYAEHYPGTKVEFHGQSQPPPPPVIPPVIPPPGYVPINRVPRGTKLAFHCIGNYPVDLVQYLLNHGVILPTMKLVQAIGDIPIVFEPHVMARMIDDPRTHAPLEGFDYTLGRGTPEQQAEARVTALWPLFAPYVGDLTSVELINEQGMPQDDPQAPAKLARFFLRAMDLLEPHGLKVAWPSASLGTPEPWQWDAMLPTGIFQRSATNRHVLSLHEYGSTMGGPNSVICRYRDLYNRILIPRGLDIACFITEFNVSDDMLGGDVFGNWVAYDNLVRQDRYIAGVHIFTVGSGMGWDNYHNATVAQFERFKAYAIAEKDKING